MQNYWNGIKDALNSDPHMKGFFEGRSKCQWTCFDSLLPEIIKTIILAGGASDITTANGKHTMTLALTGAMRACYPLDATRDQVKAAVGAMMERPQSGGSAINVNKMQPCVIPSEMPNSKWNAIQNNMEEANAKTLKKNGKIAAGFKQQRDCQSSCMRATLKASSNAQYQMAETRKAAYQAATEGAMKACMPEVPYNDVQTYVHDLTDAQMFINRLWSAGPIVEHASNNMAMITMVAGVSAFLLVAFKVGRSYGPKQLSLLRCDADEEAAQETIE